MTFVFPQLLADDVHWEKLAPIAIVFGIWALGAISSALKKSGQAMQRKAPPRPMPPVAAPPPIPPLTLAQQMGVRTQGRPTGPGGIMNILREAQARAQAEARLRAEALKQRAAPAPAKRKQQSQPAKGAPPRIVSSPAPRAPSPKDAPTPSEAASVQRSAHPGQLTVGSTKFGLRPETLRQQYILMEILQPPVSLREPRK